MAATGGGPLADDGLLLEPKKRKAGTSEEEKQDVVVGSGAAMKRSNVGTSEEERQDATGAIGTPPLSLPKRNERYRERRRVSNSKLAVSLDPRTNLPTVVKPKDPGTAHSIESPRDKALVRDAARSVVSISSFTLDGNLIQETSGVIISWNATNKSARILTTSTIISFPYDDPKLKLYVLLPNKTVLEGQLLFFNKHYEIALLEISSESDLSLHVPSFGSSPDYGQQVFVLARGAQESNLMARHGRIKWLQESKNSYLNYLMLLDCEAPMYGSGGPVVDHDGHVVGMSLLGALGCTILGISTILTCIEMWTKFSHIARPAHGLCLRTMELLDVSLQERIFLDHNITSGYIVNRVSTKSTAERLGIRRGDVIVSFNGLHDHTLPQLEDYLLSLGWGFLHRSIESSSTVDLNLEVYDLIRRTTRSITLPVEFSDGYDSEEKLK